MFSMTSLAGWAFLRTMLVEPSPHPPHPQKNPLAGGGVHRTMSKGGSIEKPRLGGFFHS